MSEDVDILLISENLSIRQRTLQLDAIMRDVATYLGIPPVEQRREEGRKLVSRFPYSDRETAIVSPSVLLELSFRGYPEPSLERVVESYVAQYMRDAGMPEDFIERDNVTLSVLAPVRTLMEKIFALHVAASNSPPRLDELRLMARYYYDIKMLLDDHATRYALGSLGDMAAYCEKELRNAGVGQPFHGATRPTGGYAESPAFRLSAQLREVLDDAYTAAMSFLFAHAEKPSLDECLECIIRHGGIL